MLCEFISSKVFKLSNSLLELELFSFIIFKFSISNGVLFNSFALSIKLDISHAKSKSVFHS